MFKYSLSTLENKFVNISGITREVPTSCVYELESSIPLSPIDLAKGLAEMTGMLWHCSTVNENGTTDAASSTPSGDALINALINEPKVMWCEGYIVEVMSEKNESEYLVKLLEELPMASELHAIFGKRFKKQYKFDINAENTFYTVSKCECQPVVTTLFSLGDSIVSKIGGQSSLKGKVVGFETSTNRIICMSDKIRSYSDDRTRYAYSIEQVEKYDPNIVKFKKGDHYNLNGNAFLCLSKDAQTVSFVRNNVIAYSGIPRTISYDDLFNLYGLTLDRIQ